MEKNLLNHLFIKLGDITLESSDAIVNAANTSLLGGGGVDGAIHRAAGPGLLQECRKIGGCMSGEARITKGYNLKSDFVIHTPGPVYKDGKNHEPEILKNSYYNSMLLVKKHSLNSVSFPAISAGVYSYPKKEAAEIAINTVLEFMKNEGYIVDVYFVLYDNDNYLIYKTILDGLKK